MMVASGVTEVAEIERAFFHRAKAFPRAQLRDPRSWSPGALPPHARIAESVQPWEESLAGLESCYGSQYAKELYG